MKQFKIRIAICLILALVYANISACCHTVSYGAEINGLTPEVGDSRLDSYVGDDTLEKDHYIVGRISLADGKPAVGQTVRVEKQIQYHPDFNMTRSAWVTYGSAVTDESGEYRIPVAGYRVYRVALGGSLSTHTEPVWVNGEDATLNLRIDFCALQGIVKNESGMAVPEMAVTLQRIGDVYQTELLENVSSDLTFADTVTGASATLDPVEESIYDGDMASVMTDAEGVFTFVDIPSGIYRIMIGRVGIIADTKVIAHDDFALLSVTEDQALIEQYRDGVLEETVDVVTEDYGTELDLPGGLLPTPTPKSDQSLIPNMNGARLFPGKTIYTDYAYTMEDFARIEYNAVPRVSYETYLSLVDPALDTTKNMKFLRVDEYRPVNEQAFINLYQSMIESYCRATGRDPSTSVLYGKADVILSSAKKYKIDPVFLATQTFHESAYGTSRLASGITITQVATEGYPRDNHGRFITRELEEPATVYNLYGIKAYDADPIVGGTSYAYYSGWTSPKAAIQGAAAYLASNYIHGDYQQNTPFKIRFTFRDRIWHQYATGPTYAEDLARYMITMAGVYSVKATFTYDLPRYREPFVVEDADETTTEIIY